MRALLSALALAIAIPVGAQETAPPVRPEVGKPLQAAIAALKARRGKEALAKARMAQAVPGKTPYESYVVTRLVGQAAALSGDAASAAPALESAAASPCAPERERGPLLEAAAYQYYAARAYSKAAAVATRYFEHGGTDKRVRMLYVNSLFQAGSFASAAREAASDVQAAERSGNTPPEDELQLLANAYARSKDESGYGRAIEKLVAYYPKRDYWVSAIDNIVSGPGFSERLDIDVFRLKYDLGILKNADEYVEYAQLALIEGFAAEASAVIDKGYAGAVLGSGPQAARHQRLRDLAAQSRAQGETPHGSESQSLFADGFNNVLARRAERGLAMMQEALRADVGLRRSDHARLELGYAYHLAGQNEKAAQVFKSVQGTHGGAALARLWLLKLGRDS
jgi:hypothetical protein